MKHIKTALVAGALIAISAASALASPALVTGDLNLRRGPGVNYPSAGVIPGGSTVHVHDCERGWCAVSAFGRNGFVSGSYLDFGGPRRYGPPPPPPVVYGPPVYGPPLYGPPIYGPRIYDPPPPYYYRRHRHRHYW